MALLVREDLLFDNTNETQASIFLVAYNMQILKMYIQNGNI